MSRRGRRRRHEADEIFLNPVSLVTPSLLSPLTSPRDVLDLEDRRQYHPEDYYRPARSVTSEDRNVNVKTPAKKFSPALPFGLQFAVPDRVAVCVRRKQRREVLFAKGRGGGGRRKRPHKNWHSKVSC